MSWNAYVDKLIQFTKDESGTFHADRACIISLPEGESWTTAEHEKNLKLHGQEGAIIARCFTSGDFTPLTSNGVTVEGVTYQLVRHDDVVVLAKKKDHGSITLQASKTAVVIAHCPEECQQEIVNRGVGLIAEYLESLLM